MKALTMFGDPEAQPADEQAGPSEVDVVHAGSLLEGVTLWRGVAQDRLRTPVTCPGARRYRSMSPRVIRARNGT